MYYFVCSDQFSQSVFENGQTQLLQFFFVPKFSLSDLWKTGWSRLCKGKAFALFFGLGDLSSRVSSRISRFRKLVSCHSKELFEISVHAKWLLLKCLVNFIISFVTFWSIPPSKLFYLFPIFKIERKHLKFVSFQTFSKLEKSLLLPFHRFKSLFAFSCRNLENEQLDSTQSN